MIKTIKIGDKNYDMKSSAYTMFAYKNETGRNLLDDISKVNDMYRESANCDDELKMMSNVMPMIDMTLQLAYIMIKEQNKEFMSYENWLKEIDGLLEDHNWIMEVLELGMSTFRRGIFSSKEQ